MRPMNVSHADKDEKLKWNDTALVRYGVPMNAWSNDE